MKPLIRGFTSTTLLKAFILNGISMALVTGLTVSLTMALDDLYAKKQAEKHKHTHDKKKASCCHHLSPAAKVGIAIGIALVSALVVYSFMWLLLGYGRGMLASPQTPPRSPPASP